MHFFSIAQALTENTALTHLDLGWCGIDADGIALLSPSLRNKLSLKYLELSGNKFGSKGAECLGRLMLSIIMHVHAVECTNILVTV